MSLSWFGNDSYEIQWNCNYPVKHKSYRITQILIYCFWMYIKIQHTCKYLTTNEDEKAIKWVDLSERRYSVPEVAKDIKAKWSHSWRWKLRICRGMDFKTKNGIPNTGTMNYTLTWKIRLPHQKIQMSI